MKESGPDLSPETNSAAADTLALVIELAEPRDFLDPELAVTAGGAVLPEPSPALFAGGDRQAAAATLERAYAQIADGRWQAAWELLAALPPRAPGPGGDDVDLLAAYAAYKSLDFPAALALLETLSARGAGTRRPAVDYYLGRVHFGSGHFRAGRDALARFAAAHPQLAAQVIAARL